MKANRIVASLWVFSLLTSCKVVNHDTAPAALPAVKVVVLSESGEAVSSDRYVGTVRTGRSMTIVTNNGGTLQGFSLRAGDKVSAGSVICKVESQNIRSAYNMAESVLGQANDGYERLSKAYASGSVPEVKMVEIRTERDKAKASFEAAQKALWHCTVTAPFSGVVEEVYVTPGSEVSLAAPLIKLVDVSSPEVHFSVPEKELSSLNVGDRMIVEVPALGKSFGATLSSKGVVASSLSHTYDCVLLPNTKISDLMPGMVCKISVAKSGGAVTVIPSTAVQCDGGGRFVWTVDQDDCVNKTYVKVSGYSGSGVVVESGCGDSLRVITEGGRKVSTGMKVKVAE